MKTMKYKLKLDYTADELKELRELSKDYESPMNAVREIADTDNGSYKVKGLQIKYANLAYEDEFDFMADINDTVMGTAIFPEPKKYYVHFVKGYKNGYTFAEIADTLECSDEDIRNIDDINQANLDVLSGLYDGTLTFSDIN